MVLFWLYGNQIKLLLLVKVVMVMLVLLPGGLIRACSLVGLERVATNHEVGGSSPSKPIFSSYVA